jgi:hypothetical protein
MFLYEYSKAYADAFEARHGDSPDDDCDVTDCEPDYEPEPEGWRD